MCNAVIFGIDMADDARVIPLAMASNERMICFFFFLFPKSTSLMWWKYAAVCLLACLVAPCQAYFRGDPVLCCTSSSPNRTCISRVPSLDLHQNIFPRNKSLTNTNISQTMTVVSVRACVRACLRGCVAHTHMLTYAYTHHQVQMFKRMQYQGKRSVWSDVLVGQGPLFSVDRAVRAPPSLPPSIISRCIIHT